MPKNLDILILTSSFDVAYSLLTCSLSEKKKLESTHIKDETKFYCVKDNRLFDTIENYTNNRCFDTLTS